MITEKLTGCYKETSVAINLLYIDQPILKDKQTKRKNLAMVWHGESGHVIW